MTGYNSSYENETSIASTINHYGQCRVVLHWPVYFPPLIGLGIFATFLIAFGTAYTLRERDRIKNYYDRIDAASRKSVKETPQELAKPVQEVSCPRQSSNDDDDAAEDELHGRNPNKVSVVRDVSPTNNSNGIKIMIQRRKSVSRSVVNNSVSGAVSSAVSALSIFSPRILFDSTGRGLEIIDIVSKSAVMMQFDINQLRDGLLDVIRENLDQIRDRSHVVFGILDKGEPIIKGASKIGMMRQLLVLSLGCDTLNMKIYCYQLDLNDAPSSEAVVPTIPVLRELAPAPNEGSSLATIMAPTLGSGSGSKTAKTYTASAKDQRTPVVGPPKTIARSTVKSATVERTQTITAPVRSPLPPSLQTCRTRKSARTPTPTQKKSTKRQLKRSSNRNRRSGRQTPAQTPRTLVTAIESSLYSTSHHRKDKSPQKEQKMTYDV